MLTLFEENDVTGVKPEKRVAFEKLLCLSPGRTAGHDVPWNDDRALWFPRSLGCDVLETSDAFGLVLEERFV